MDQFNVLDIMHITTVDSLDQDYNQWELFPYDLRKKSDDVCIQKYGCNNTQLYNIMKAKLIQYEDDGQDLVAESVDMKIMINKIKFALNEGFTTDKNKDELLGYMKNGMINDRLNKIEQSKNLMKFDDDWVIICDFIDDDHPDYTINDLNNLFAKYNSSNTEHRTHSDEYSVQIWGRSVFGMYSYMKQKFEILDTKDQDIEFVPDKNDQDITNYTRTIETESGDDLQLMIRKMDCYNTSPIRSLYESKVLEQFGDKIKVGNKTYRQDLPGVVPFLTYTEYLHNRNGLDQKKINNVDPFTYVFNKKHTAESLQELYRNGQKEELLEFGWNPEVEPTVEAILYAREKQIKWFDEHKLFKITDISNFDLLSEASEESTSKLTPVFLVVNANKFDKNDAKRKIMSKIGFNTLKDYNNVGLSLEPSLNTIYSIDYKSKGNDTKSFEVRSVRDYADDSNIYDTLFVLAFFVKASVKKTIKTSMTTYVNFQDNSKYKFDNIDNIITNKVPKSNAWNPYVVIGQFMDTIFKISNLYDNMGKQEIGAGLDQSGGNFYVLYSGPAKDYKENKVKKKIDGLKKISTFSTLNFFGTNTNETGPDPEDYGYYTFDAYLKKYTNEAVDAVVQIIRQDILNPDNNEFKWVDDSEIITKDIIMDKMKNMEQCIEYISGAKDNEIIDYIQRIKLDKMYLLKAIRDGILQDNNDLMKVKYLIDKTDQVIKYYTNYSKQFNYQPAVSKDNRIVIHDTNDKFKYSSENFKYI